MATITPFTTSGLTLLGSDLLARRASASAPLDEHRDLPLLPLTDAQREIWLACQFSANASIAYNESATLELAGALDVHALHRALARLVERHEALRVTFTAAGDAQRIAPTAPVDLQVHDFSSETEEERGTRARDLAERHVHRPFDLVKGPLFRAALVRLDSRCHRLVLAVHHLVCDGWSLSVLQRELGELYSAEAAGREPTLTAAPSLAEFVQAQAGARESVEFKQAEAFWREQFADEAPVVELPTDRPRTSERSYAADFLAFTLPVEIAAAIKRICVEHECTTFTALFAAFGVLVHRLSGQDDIVVGVPSATQVMGGHSGLVGHFANLLPVRSRLRDGQTFHDYLQETSRSLTASVEHWRYPFGTLVQQLNLPRDPSRQPLAPILFNSVRHGAAPRFEGLRVTPVPATKQFLNFDLDFVFAPTGDTFSLGCHYSSELYERATLTRWFGHFERLLRGIAANPRAPVAELPLLNETERQQLLVEWNNTALDYDREACVHALFEREAQRQPDAIALIGRGERWSYAKLNQRADEIAAELVARGVGPDSPVGIFLERTPQLVAAMLGVLKAGGAYVPLDVTYPKERLAFIVNDTGMKVVLTQRNLAAYLPLGEWEPVILDDSQRVEDRRATARFNSPTLATNLAYIIYTSGSTGQPKGVGVPHRGVAALTAWARQHYSPEELAAVLFATSVCFDVSVFESLVPLCLGGKIILAPNVLELGSVAHDTEVTLISGVPSAMAELVRANAIPRSVRTVNVAGEPCPQSLVDSLYALGHIGRVVDAYGPTETTVYSTATVRQPGGRATIGRPLPNEQAYILDRRMQPVPIGVPGELYLGGDKLARGYLNRPKLTRERFVTAPFLPGRRLYRTGDAARFLPDGNIEFLGRLDHQVKVRGYRIELGEIEAALARNAAVTEAVAIVRPDTAGHARILAYVALAHESTTPDSLRSELAQRLPEYMLPAAIVRLDKLPRTTSGKIDRRALPNPDFSAAEAHPVAPRTELEEIVLGVWRDVLGIERLGVHDNFFALGGHSLLAAQVIVRLQHALNVQLTLQQFFATPTIAGLAPAIEVALIEEITAAAAEQSAPDRSDPALAAKESP